MSHGDAGRQGVQPFTIDIPDGDLADLRQRLANTRWSPRVEGTAWAAGTDLDYLEELVDYWRDRYDWRQQEADRKSVV